LNESKKVGPELIISILREAKKPLTKALKLADQKTRNNEMGKISLEGTMRYQNILDENESLEQ